MSYAMAQHGNPYVSSIRRGEETNLHENDHHPGHDAGAARLRGYGKRMHEKRKKKGHQSREKRVCEEEEEETQKYTSRTSRSVQMLHLSGGTHDESVCAAVWACHALKMRGPLQALSYLQTRGEKTYKIIYLKNQLFFLLAHSDCRNDLNFSGIFVMNIPMPRFLSSLLRALSRHKLLAVSGVIWAFLFFMMSRRDKFDRLSDL